MNFLELANKVASDSGTMSGETPISTVVGQTGRPAKILRWTREAYNSIQLAHRGWRWMQSEWTGATQATVHTYAATSFNDMNAGGLITRFGSWVCRGSNPDNPEDRYVIYDPAIGLNDKGRLRFVPWERFFRDRVNTAAPNGKPTEFTIDPRDNLRLFPTPNAIYNLFGPYRKSAQTLTANDDVPEMPVDYHDVIVQIACQYMETSDEAPTSLIELRELRNNRSFCRLEEDQLPQLTWGGPLV